MQGSHSGGIAVVGGGPAGMTSALLLARSGRRVTIFERAPELGGLWSSRLDADGYFRADNSCKVYQPGYHTTPALLELIGTNWREHFTQRHDLTTDWLRPFMADCSWRDLTTLAAAFVRHSAGFGRYHRISVSDFIDAHGLSESCQNWMRATALGGIAGTVRMTMWELFHRLSSNITEVLRGEGGPLFWNTHPPNSRGGFVTIWREALDHLGVVARTNTAVSRLSAHDNGRGVSLTTNKGAVHDADAVFLAVPPPALADLLRGSDDAITQGFGLSRSELESYLAESHYAHVGITWFFDRALPDLPLGGHNVRTGWHPILVQHDQYRAALRPPAMSVVVGSVAVDTEYRHQRLDTMAREHSVEELAGIIWDDERRRDPSLPEPIDVEIIGTSSATQIVRRGPLPPAMPRSNVFLSTNLHGRAPYFTASLESAIQAGAIAARRFDPSVERLPMGALPRLPWTDADRGAACPPRESPPRASHPACADSS